MGLAVVSSTTSSPQHRPPDLRSTVENLRRRHRRSDEGEIAQYLMTAVSENDDLLLQCCQFVVAKIGAAIDAQVRRLEAAPRDA